MNTLKASNHPLEDIERVSYKGQDPLRRQFRPGFDWAMNRMPVLSGDDIFLDSAIQYAGSVMKELARRLTIEDWVINKKMAPDTFERTIIGIEAPYIADEGTKEGAEIVVAQWGKGFSSPVHGHAAGYLHEEVLTGKVRVNTYRMINPDDAVVRPVRTDIVGTGTFASIYTPSNPRNRYARQTLIHNFIALETTSTLHFLPEHTRDGRDNRFEVEYFEDVHHLSPTELTPYSAQDAFYSRKGDVYLVRSSNVPEYGDHYIVITGAPVMKEHGLRPQDIAIQAPHASSLLSHYNDAYRGLLLLKLNKETAKRFHEFHGITFQADNVVFPTA